MTQQPKSGERKSSRRLIFEEEPISKQELINQGESAAQMLNNPVYNLSHRSAVTAIQDEWMQTSPHEKEKREGLYQEMRALSRVSLVFMEMVNEATALSDEDLNQERSNELYQ